MLLLNMVINNEKMHDKIFAIWNGRRSGMIMILKSVLTRDMLMKMIPIPSLPIKKSKSCSF